MNLINAHFRTMPEEETKRLFIEFVQMVRSMRDFQREYFKTHNTLVLADEAVTIVATGSEIRKFSRF